MATTYERIKTELSAEAQTFEDAGDHRRAAQSRIDLLDLMDERSDRLDRD